jgi:glycosyltransferase involved in cell wall biosynthesis
MKVLVTAQYFPPDMGGGATRAYNVAKGLVINGWKVTVIAAFPHYPTGNTPRSYRWKPFHFEDFDGMRVFRTFVPPVASEGLAKRLLLFFSFMISSLLVLPYVGQVDIVWAANPNLLSVFPASFYGLIKGKSVALNVDDLWPEVFDTVALVEESSVFYRVTRFIARFAYSKADLVTPISPGYVSVICGKYGTSFERTHVVRAGVDLDKFSGASGQHRCDQLTFKVIYSGAFSIAYDFEQVLLAANILADRNDVEFILQGAGELLNSVKSRVKGLSLKNVRIIDQIVTREEVAKLLDEGDALLLPLRDFGTPYQGISSKLYEYQAMGKPILCCATGQPAEYVKETRSGIVISPGDYESLAEAIVHLKEDLVRARLFGENGRDYVEKHVSIKEIGKQMSELLFATSLRELHRSSGSRNAGADPIEKLA